MAYINLYSVPECDMSYEHAPYFGSKQAQGQWFLNKRKVQIDARISVDPNRTSVTIGESYATIESWNVDYCSLTDPSGRTIYYFVADYDYTTTNATTLILVLDPLQTYMFDFTFKDSFVERCHVDRWKDGMPTKEYVPEGLDFGENIPVETKTIHTFDTDNYLIIASSPLGMLNRTGKKTDGQGGGSVEDCGSWKDGYMSAEGFRFVKGYEGFGPRPYKDDLGYWTIAYGVTKHGEPDIYAKLEAMQPVPEEEGAKITYELKKKNYGDKILQTCHELGITKQCQFDALMAFSFNLGTGVINDSNSKLHKAIKKDISDEAAIREAFVAYRNPGSNVEEGLKARRNEECDIFFGRYPEPRKIRIIGGKGYVEENNGNGWLPTGCGGDIPDINEMKAYTAYGKKFIYPLQGGRSTITSKLGWRKHPIHGTMKFHHGDDIGCPLNEPVYAAHDGKVIKADGSDAKGYGNWIILQNDNLGIQTYYAHNNKLLVTAGQEVKAGHKIALAGSTGASTGPHLHYELRNKPYSNNEVVDPLPHIKVGAKL